MSSEYVAKDPQLTGSPGTEIWAFRAIGEGTARISFKYVRLWEKEAEPAGKMAFDIVVTRPKTECVPDAAR
mgnify:CR=1 FL=1